LKWLPVLTRRDLRGGQPQAERFSKTEPLVDQEIGRGLVCSRREADRQHGGASVVAAKLAQDRREVCVCREDDELVARVSCWSRSMMSSTMWMSVLVLPWLVTGGQSTISNPARRNAWR